MKVLHLIDALDCNGSSRQIHLLGPALGNDNLSVEICCLGPAGFWLSSLRDEGVPVTTLNWTRWLDPGVLWNLRSLVTRLAPDLIHVWRLPALRALAIAAPSLLTRVVMSAPLPPHGKLPWWDRWLLKRVRCLAVAGVSDQARCLHQGLAEPTLRVVPPAVAMRAETPKALTFPRQAPSILCIGKLERDEGFRLAIWAFDILRQIHEDAQLFLVGTGSQQAALYEMTQGLQNSDSVHFLGEQSDLTSLLQSASVVWIPSVTNCGRQVALDAMAQGCTVVASDVPCLRDVIVDGETGYLVLPGDAVPLARRTHQLFRDPMLARRLGETARRQMEERFSLAETVQRWREVYATAA